MLDKMDGLRVRSLRTFWRFVTLGVLPPDRVTIVIRVGRNKGGLRLPFLVIEPRPQFRHELRVDAALAELPALVDS